MVTVDGIAAVVNADLLLKKVPLGIDKVEVFLFVSSRTDEAYLRVTADQRFVRSDDQNDTVSGQMHEFLDLIVRVLQDKFEDLKDVIWIWRNYDTYSRESSSFEAVHTLDLEVKLPDYPRKEDKVMLFRLDRSEREVVLDVGDLVDALTDGALSVGNKDLKRISSIEITLGTTGFKSGSPIVFFVVRGMDKQAVCDVMSALVFHCEWKTRRLTRKYIDVIVGDFPEGDTIFTRWAYMNMPNVKVDPRGNDMLFWHKTKQ